MKLFDYQMDAVKFCLARKATYLALHPGLGKSCVSITASLAWMANHADWRKVLVVCPAGLKNNWLDEWSMWHEAFPIQFPLTFGLVDGSTFPDADVTIISWDMLHREQHQERLSQDWDIIIADEVHMGKSVRAKRTKSLVKLKARRKLALSGTPMPNRPVELFAVLKWLQPSKWDYWRYVHQFCDAKKGYGNSLDVSGSSNLNQLFAILTKGPDAVMLRMRKQDVLKQLPDKMHQIIRLPAPEKCKALIDEETKLWTVRKEALDQLRQAREDASTGNVEAYRLEASNLNSKQSVAMAEMAKIRQQLAVAKSPLCIQFAKDLLDGGTDKLLMFGHHRTGLEIVAEGLKDYGAQLLYGGGDPMKRQEMVKKFQSDKEARVMVIGTQAGGVGLNLTAASRVIMMESQWNDAGNDQAADRAHRIGQTKNVLVTWLVFDGSVDSRVLQTCLKKTSISEAAIDGIVPVQQGEPKAEKPKTDWKTIGKQMSDADKRAAQEAIRAIALLDSDAARSCNGLGFSKVDSELGRKLACLIAPSDGQYAVMRHMSLKYRSQLSPDLRIKLLNNNQTP